MENQLVAGWIGKMGSGKTLNMTKWALVFSDALNLPLYSNYTINWPTAHKFNDFRQLEDKHDCIVVYDEIHIDFDSRDWDKKIRYQFTQWFTQLRKRNIIFLYSTQRPNTLEKRIRENTDYLFLCKKIRQSFQQNNSVFGNLFKKWFGIGDKVELDIPKEFSEEVMDTQMGFEMAEPIKKFIVKKPWLMYDLYNTHEIIKKDSVYAKSYQ